MSLRVGVQLRNVLWVLLNKCNKSKEDISKIFGRNKQWIDAYMNKSSYSQIVLTDHMVQGLNKLGYDVQIVKLERKVERNEQEAMDGA